MRADRCALALAVLALAACAPRSRDYGTGVNTVERKYPRPAKEVWGATVAAVKSFDFKIDSDKSDEMGGELRARRADGQSVVVSVRALDPNDTSVSVRVEPGDRNMAQMIHDRIGQKLGVGGQTRAPSPGGRF